jgi:hydroxyethylthiazole kinase-like uncharacterized protein yjeF
MGALPAWTLPLPDAELMRAIDRWAIADQKVPSLELMERAGAGVARAVEELAGDGPVTVLCGKGNNGGDGLVAARCLREAGIEVAVCTVAPPAELQGDAGENLRRLPGAPPVPLDFEGVASAVGAGAAGGAQAIADLLYRSTVIVDALLGTGFAGEPRGTVAAAIDAVNAVHTPVVSVDVPSGVDASTGVVAAQAIRATITVTFHAAKPGLWIHPGKAHAGEVRTIDIGIPRGAPDAVPGISGVAPGAPGVVPNAPGVAPGAPHAARVGLIEAAVLDLLPRRGASSTKFSSGHVLVAGGSRGLTGAPRMAAHAAMRAGAGYVTACVPASLQAVLAAGGLPELMTQALPDADGSLSAEGVDLVLDAATARGSGGRAPAATGRSRAPQSPPNGASTGPSGSPGAPGSPGPFGPPEPPGPPGAPGSPEPRDRRGGGALVLALGPGLGRAPGAFAFARELARRAPVAIVIDADGLNAHAGRLGELAARPAPTILTPHAGELARLLELSSAEIERERLRHVRAAAELAGAIVVLKGDDTLIADPTGAGTIAVSRGASPALATAGTGDVLTGVIAALLSQGLEPFTAAAAGVQLHATAGRLAARMVGAAEGVIASDVIAALPAARAEVGGR